MKSMICKAISLTIRGRKLYKGMGGSKMVGIFLNAQARMFQLVSPCLKAFHATFKARFTLNGKEDTTYEKINNNDPLL